MKRVFRPLLVMHPESAFRERVRQACGSDYHFQAVSDWDEMLDAVRDSPPAALLVVDPYETPPGGYRYGANGSKKPPLAPALRGLLAEYPSTAVLAAMEVTPDRFDDLRTLGKWGVVQVISLDHDDTPYAIGQRLRAARGRPLRALLEQVLPPETPGSSARHHGGGDGRRDGGAARERPRQVAAPLPSHAAAVVPARRPARPPALLAWMRVLLACELLDDPGRTVLSVAHTCGYSSDSGLRRITQKFLDASPTDLREQGAFARASAEFVEVLNESRKAKWSSREG
jgi:AraC-like DNA-binding protein